MLVNNRLPPLEHLEEKGKSHGLLYSRPSVSEILKLQNSEETEERIMHKRDSYAPDYQKLYPGVIITPDVMRVLTNSDRKMKYCEFDLKTERARWNKKAQKVITVPAREDSLERLGEKNDPQLVSDWDALDNALVEREELERLKAALAQLPPDEWQLIDLLYYQGISQLEAGETLGVSQQAVSKRAKKILGKLRNLIKI